MAIVAHRLILPYHYNFLLSHVSGAPFLQKEITEMQLWNETVHIANALGHPHYTNASVHAGIALSGKSKALVYQ